MRTDYSNAFRTTSLSLAIFLRAKGERVAGVVHTDNPTKKEFKFENSATLEALIETYKFGERDGADLLVPVHVYEHARNELLDRLNE